MAEGDPKLGQNDSWRGDPISLSTPEDEVPTLYHTDTSYYSQVSRLSMYVHCGASAQWWFVMFCFLFFWKFLLPIGVHNSCRISTMTGLTCHNLWLINDLQNIRTERTPHSVSSLHLQHHCLLCKSMKPIMLNMCIGHRARHLYTTWPCIVWGGC